MTPNVVPLSVVPNVVPLPEGTGIRVKEPTLVMTDQSFQDRVEKRFSDIDNTLQSIQVCL